LIAVGAEGLPVVDCGSPAFRVRDDVIGVPPLFKLAPTPLTAAVSCQIQGSPLT